MPHIVAETGPLAGQRVEVAGELTIGRDGADLEIDDPKISRHHATFRAVPGGLEVEDLGSTNGTFVEGQRIEGTVKLKNGSSVRLGGSTFTAEVEAQATQLEEAPTSGATQVANRQVESPQVESPQVESPQVESPQVESPQTPSDATIVHRTRAPSEQAPETPAPPITPSAEPVTAASPPVPPPASPPSPPAAAPAPGAPRGQPAGAPAFQAGQFLPAHARRGGLATRSWLPVVLSYGTAALVAIALVIYFAAR